MKRPGTRAGAPGAVVRGVGEIAAAVLPRGGPFPEGAADAECGRVLDELWPDLQANARASIALMTAAVLAACRLRTGRPLRRLEPEAAARFLDHLEQRAREPLRSSYAGVKTLILVLAAADPGIEARLGLDAWPPNLLRPDRR